MERVRLTESEESSRLSDIFFDRLESFLQQVKDKPILTRPLKAFEIIYSKDKESPLVKKGISPVFPLVSPFFVDNWFLFVDSEGKVTSCFSQLPEELGEKDIEDLKRMFIESLALAEDPYFSPLKALDKKAIFGAFEIFSTIYSDFNISEYKGKKAWKKGRNFLGEEVKVKSSYFEEEINRFFQMADVILQDSFFASLINDETSSINEALITTILQTKESEGISDNFKTMVKYVFNQLGAKFSFFADLFSDKTLSLSEFWLKAQAMRYLAELHLSEGVKEKFIGAIDAVLEKIEQKLNEGEKVRRRNEVYFEYFINNPQDENAKLAKKLFLSALFPFSNLEAESLKEFSFEDILAKLFQGLDRQRIIYEIATGKLLIPSEKITTVTSFLLKEIGIDDNNLINHFLFSFKEKHGDDKQFFLTADQFLNHFLEFFRPKIETAYKDYSDPFYVFFVANYYGKFFEKLTADTKVSAELFDFERIRKLGEINIWEVVKSTADLVKRQSVKEDGQKKEFPIEEIKERLIELGHNPFVVEEIVDYVFHLSTTLHQLSINGLRLFKPKGEGQAYSGVKNLLIQGPPGTGKTRLVKELMKEIKNNFYTVSLNGSALVVEPYKGLTFRQVLADLIKRIAEEKNISINEAVAYLYSRGAIFVIDEVDNLLAIRTKAGADDESRLAAAKDFNILLDTTPQEIVFEIDGTTFTISTENLYFILIGSFSDSDIVEVINLINKSPLLGNDLPEVKTNEQYFQYTQQVKDALGLIVSPDLIRRLLVVPVPEPNLALVQIYTLNLLNGLWTELQSFLKISKISSLPIDDKKIENIKKLAEYIFKNKLYSNLGEVYTRALIHLKAFLAKEKEVEEDLFQLVLGEVLQQLQSYQ